jgi:hypothetical protein
MANLRKTTEVFQGAFTLVSFTHDNVADTLAAYIPELLSPLILHPLPHDFDPSKAAWAIASRGDDPTWGPPSHICKVSPTAVQVNVWNVWKRNQILRHPIVNDLMARISPGELPAGMEDKTAFVVYNRGAELTTNEVEELVRSSLPESVEPPKAFAQYYDLAEDAELQKWLVCFDKHESVQAALANKEWIRLAGRSLNAELSAGPCRGPPVQKPIPPPPTKDRKKNPKAKDKGQGYALRGRKGK